jgi:hypothetical protein
VRTPDPRIRCRCRARFSVCSSLHPHTLL